ncbi:MAG: hypothetical protein FWE68_04870, partial [Defluviitaleaceae bacterium]|nr:hypothetical protein [Defluviitaleaceae bacterium]
MEVLSAQVLNGFRVRAKRVVKEKSYYICATGDGHRVIRKSLDNRAHIIFQHALKEQLHDRGFSDTDRYFPAADGSPFFEHEGNVYVMTGLFRQREADFGSAADLGNVLRGIAAFHNAARGLTFEHPFHGDENILDSYRRQAAEIDGIKKLIGQKRRLSDFDVVFLKNYDDYRRLMSESISILESTKLAEFKAAAKAENAVCHNLLKEEHLLIDGSNVSIVGFSQASVDYF